MSDYTRQIIRDKRRWHHQATPEEEALGFRGWHSRGYLPHFDAPGAQQFITYRLADAMPAARRSEWEALFHLEDEREKRQRIEEYLDRGHGECHLRDARLAALVQENLLHFDGKDYRVLAWVIMPNHVHTLIEIWQKPMSEVVKSWKSYTAKEANKVLLRAGKFWQDDYFDTYLRDEEHFRKTVRYIENNPAKVRLVRAPEDWSWGSARYRGAPGPVVPVLNAPKSGGRAVRSLQGETRGQAVRAPEHKTRGQAGRAPEHETRGQAGRTPECETRGLGGRTPARWSADGSSARTKNREESARALALPPAPEKSL